MFLDLKSDGRLDLRRRKLVAFSSSRHNEKGGREKKMMSGIYVSLSFTVQQQTSGNDRWSFFTFSNVPFEKSEYWNLYGKRLFV
ncbi:hypothetical protein OUZ56_013938 [Daphnia magna]|uniref:Uncharacterized protein n=1 Tax=Daphnia magna TaxID=35525 RepID=A0ABQ9Z7E0_9CRUS|nr:hypothetical protein OUZ56_013938 [Daphnia magna]